MFQEKSRHKSLLPRERPDFGSAPSFLAVDFFCGAGGTTRGLIDAGGYVLAGIDKMESCRRTYVSNNSNETGDRGCPIFLALDLFPKEESYPDGQQKEAFENLDALIRTGRRQHPDIPLLFAICAPCQPFTKLNKSEMSSARAMARLRDRNLLKHACRFVRRYSPDLILSENVSGIMDARYGGVWETFENDLENLGFSVRTTRICASDFGIPQFRKRTILAGIRNMSDRFAQNFDLPSSDASASRLTVRQALADLPELGPGERHGDIPNHATRGLNDLNFLRISHAPPGGSNEYLLNTPDGDLSLACHRRVNGKFNAKCFTDVYTRMAPDRPSPTVTTRCHSITNGRFGHYDPVQPRGISMREAARLQSFEDDYVFYPEDKVQPVARMIGNAVPPKLARFYATHLLHAQANLINDGRAN